MAFVFVALLGPVWGTVATLGAAIGLGFLANKLSPKQKDSKFRGSRVGLRIDPNAPREVLFGECGTFGSLVYWHLYGANNEYLQMVIALCDHRSDSLQSIEVDNVAVTWNSVDGTITEYPGTLWVKFYNGAQTTADADLVANSGGRWTANEVGRNVSYAVVTAKYDETKFPGGIPKMFFILRGFLAYDARKDTTVGGSGLHRWNDPATWEWTRNPTVLAYSVVRGLNSGTQLLVGLQAPHDAIKWDDFVAAANACDEAVAKKAGGTEARYAADGVWEVKPGAEREILEDLASAMAGDIVESGGIYRILPGVAQTPVATLNDADLIVTKPFTSDPKRARTELINAVFGSYRDPERQFNAIPLPPRTSASDETEDGGKRYAVTYQLDAVTSRSQGQRVMEVQRKKARRQLIVRGTLRARWFVLEPGDWVTVNSDRRGYVGRTFRIEDRKSALDLTTEVTLRETDAGIDDWVPSTDELDDNTSSDLPPAGPPLSTVPGFAVAVVSVLAGGGAERPGIQATWTAITDRTVTAILFEYRKLGDTVALSVRAEIPSEGEYTWVNGVQGQVTYEVRARLVTEPARAVSWTSWLQPAAQTADQVVNVGAIVNTPPFDTIGPEHMDPQTRFEHELITETEGSTGSISNQAQEVFNTAQTAAEATLAAMADAVTRPAKLSRQTEFEIGLATALESVFGSAAQRSAEAFQNAQQAAEAAIAGLVTGQSNKVRVVSLTEEVGDISARWGVAIVMDGLTPRVLGLVQLDGSASGSEFSVVADKFTVAQPGISGGNPVPVFTIANVDGTPKLALRGDMLVDGSILARHIDVGTLSAISADIGEVTAGLMQSPDGEFVIDLTNKEIVIST